MNQIIARTNIRPDFLSFSPPCLGEEEIEEAVAALRSGWISRGPRTALFEEAFREHLGAPAALALNSCTSGLHLALKVLNIGLGEEVIVPTLTFCASVNVIEHVGATPVLVDVESDTLNINPDAIEAAITERTRAIMVVHYGGHPAEMEALTNIADRYGLSIVEDAAHALPAAYRGQVVGSTRRLTAFSFYATKNLTTCEGGMLTGDPELLARARLLSLHGMSGNAWARYRPGGSWFYEVTEPGFKYNMTDIEAAIGLCQLQKLGSMQQRRREIVAMYTTGLEGLASVQLPIERSDVRSAWHLFPLRIKADRKLDRNKFIERMQERNVGTSVHFIPVHLHPYYAGKYGYTRGDLTAAEAAFDELVSIPLHPGLSDDDAAYVINAVVESCEI